MVPKASTAPNDPIRLMIAFALERNGLMVTSGINETAGDLNVDMASKATNKVRMKTIKVPGACVVTSQARRFAC